MAVESTLQLEPGTTAPSFALPDLEGTVRSLADWAHQPLLIVFSCNHCPLVKHVENELGRIARDYAGRLQVVAICSNDMDRYEDDRPDKLREQIERAGWTFPYLVDASQDVATSYGAACTPDLFLLDADHRLAYRGRLDETRPSSGAEAHGADIRTAIDAVLAGNAPAEAQYPSIGCGIKWKPGNEPA